MNVYINPLIVLPQSAISSYNHALLLYKTYNSENQNSDLIDSQFNHNFNKCTNNVNFHNISKNKQGKNILCERFTILNNKIP